MKNLSELLEVGSIRPFVRADGVCIDIDEFLQQSMTKAELFSAHELCPDVFTTPLSAQLELTSRCNQRCLTCYNRSGESTDIASELSVDEWLGVADQLCALYIYDCVISGGEPTLLGEDLFRIMDRLHEGNVTFVLITNGMRVDEAFVRCLMKYRFRWVQVSIDGLEPETHEYVRQAPGSWERAVRAADLIQAAGLPLVIAHTIVRQNVHDVGKMIDFCSYLGAKRVVISPFLYSGRSIGNQNVLGLTQEQIREYQAVAMTKAKEYHHLGHMEVVEGLGTTHMLKLTLLRPARTMLIRPDGNVRIDCVLPFSLGNVREASLESMWQKAGRSSHRSSQVRNYAARIKCDSDLLNVTPRPYVDPDEVLVG